MFDGTVPSEALTAYSLDPATRNELGPEACDGRRDGNTVRFEIDVTGQPDDSEFRLLGSIILDLPNNAEVGSQDDFHVRTTLATVRG